MAGRDSSSKPAPPGVPRPLLDAPSRLKLAIFATNMQAGATLAHFDGELEGTWEETLRIARRADQVGFEALIPIGRWRGYGGDHDLGARSFETLTWASGLLASTSRIQVVATVHVPLIHPLVGAKMIATADHISSGRAGLNVVAGSNPGEFAMFGIEGLSHDERYAVADEWTRIAKQLWTSTEELDFHGRHFDIIGGTLDPKPVQQPYPVLMSAGISPAGRQFAARHCDVIFSSFVTDLTQASRMVESLRAQAGGEREHDLRVFGRAHIVCRDTEAEAKRYFERVHTEHADRAAAHEVLSTIMANSQGQDWSAADREQMANALIQGWFALPVVGTPEQVAEALIGQCNAGMDGLALSWPDYEDGIERFAADVLPLLVQAGVRV